MDSSKKSSGVGNYTFTGKLGQGHQATVYRGNNGISDFAVKVFENEKDLKQEVENIKRVPHHENIL